MKSKSTLLLLAVALAAAWNPVFGADKTWDGGATGNNTWTAAANWDLNVAPSANDVLFFAGSVQSTTSNTFAANTQFNGLTFNSGASAFTLAGNAIKLGGNITNSSSVNQTISLALALQQNTVVDAGSAGITTISGAVSGAFSLDKVGAGTLALGNSTNSFSGGLRINDGTLKTSGSAASVGSGTITLGSVAGTENVTLDLTSNFSYSNAIVIAAGTGTRTIIESGSGSSTINGTVALNQDLILDGGTKGLLLYGAITGNKTIIIRNTGSVAISSGNASKTSFTGMVSIENSATLYAGGSGTANELDNAVIDILSGGTLDVKANMSIAGLTGQAGSIVTDTNTTAKTLSIVGSGSYIFNGVIQNGLNALSLTMNGTGGTQTLTGINTYSGATTITAGTLRAGSSSAFGTNSAVTMANTSGAVLDLAGFNNSIGSLVGGGTTGGNVTLGTGTLTTGGLNSSTTYAGVISGAGGLTKTGTGSLTLTGNNTYGGGTTISAGTIQLNRTIGSLAGGPLTINGLGGTFIMDNVASSGPLSQSLGVLSFNAGDGTVKTNRTATQNTAITFSSLSARPSGAAGTFVIAGTASAANGIVIAGQATGFVDKGIFYGNGSGSGGNYAWYDAGGFVRGINYGVDFGTATSGANSTLVGATNQQITGAISAQDTAAFTTLQISGNNNLTLASGAILTVSGILKQGNSAGGATISGGAGIQALNDGEMVVRADMSNDTLAISSNILANGANAFTKSGAGSLTLTGTNSYIGTTTVLGGSLQLGNGNSTGTLSSAGTIHLNGGSLIINRNNAVAQGTDFSAAAITGSGSLFHLGSGTLAFNAANTYVGNTTLGIAGGASVGTLSLSGSGKIGSAVLTLYGGTLDLANTTQTITSLDLGSGAAGTSANISIGAGGVLNLGGQVSYNVANNPNGATISGSGNGTLNLLGDRTFAVGNSSAADADITISAIIANGDATARQLTKTLAGTLVLTGLNTYTGITQITTGVLSVANIGNGGVAGNIGAASNANTNIYLDGTLQYTGAAASTDRLFRIGTAAPTLDASGSGAINFSNVGSLSCGGSAVRTLTLTGNNTDNNTLASIIINVNTSNSTTLIKSGVGTWVLSGNNTYTGTTTLSAGTLQFAKAASLYTGNSTKWTAANIKVGSGATLALNVGGGTEFSTGNVTTLLANLGGTNGTSTTGFAAGSKIGFDTTGGNFTVGDNMADSIGTGGGAIGLTKLGGNALTLSGTSTYTGTTTVTAGTMILSGSLANTTGVTVSGGTLQLAASDRINSAATLALSGGTLDGASFTQGLGVLTLSGNSFITLSGGSLTFADSHLATWGAYTLTLTGFVPGSSLKFGTSATGLDSTQLAKFRATGYDTFSLDGSGYLSAIAVPEPGTCALLAMAFTAAAVLRRRRRAR